MTSTRSGYLYGVAAYGLWGAFPLYFPLLQPGGAGEILAHRILWSAVTLVLLVVALRRGRRLADLARDRRTALFLLAAAVVISLNWGGFIFGVTSGRVVEVSLGYFINPLVSMLLGVLVLGERMRPAQWVAIGIGALACGVLTWDYGRLPWVALLLAFSFGTYGLCKKKANAGAIESLTFETVLVAPVAVAWVAWLWLTGNGHFTTEGPGHAVLLMTAGLVTAVPLLCFGAAATRIPLSAIGLLQYIAPISHFLLGITVFDEVMPAGRWAGFCLVWLALAVFTTDALRARHRRSVLVRQAAAP
ncbi:EamA family transporter RarD [Nocardioides panacisoli]|uniref:EamA family transporter RarD n=1 Tax=Nocardioides panacisoli TaxID=627624 RepID=UPI001C6317B8|nr:EamA family transporter RarD [Nocardioides panacisoli]QYJ03814.1 EamA family transporter RarD [Nocardioides panacisoli]